jgi:hypothetical protein
MITLPLSLQLRQLGGRNSNDYTNDDLQEALAFLNQHWPRFIQAEKERYHLLGTKKRFVVARIDSREARLSRTRTKIFDRDLYLYGAAAALVDILKCHGLQVHVLVCGDDDAVSYPRAPLDKDAPWFGHRAVVAANDYLDLWHDVIVSW